MKNANGAVREASLADYTAAPLLLPRLKERDAAGVIQELSRALHQQGAVPDLLPFYNAALTREYLTTTAVPGGMAFPHARLAGIAQVRFAFGHARERIQWGSRGVCPVEFVFLLAVPATETGPYLSLVAGLARIGRSKEFLERLREAEAPDDILAVLNQMPLRRNEVPIS